MVGQSDRDPITIAIGAARSRLTLSPMAGRPPAFWKARHLTRAPGFVKASRARHVRALSQTDDHSGTEGEMSIDRSEDLSVNPRANAGAPTIGDVLAERLSRRGFLTAAAAGAALAGAGCATAAP
ncbi:MAG: twin-arginine translocation signal domain-containing protein, partial [Oceanicaulis sp.]